MANDIAVIANITEQQWMVHRTYGTFVVRGCVELGRREAGDTDRGVEVVPIQSLDAPEEAYALTEVGARQGKIDLGDNRSLEVPISAREVAADICREINSDGGEASYFGVFMCAGEQPTAGEMAEARAKLRAFYERQVFVADREWERSHSHILINDVQRRAARALGLDKEWAYDPGAQMECPACGSKVKTGLAVCRVCDAVLDREKAVRFGILRESSGESAGAPASGPAGASAICESNSANARNFSGKARRDSSQPSE